MLYLLDDTPPDMPFPLPENAQEEPDGLLAVGGDLHPRRLVNAYRHGIFPWFSDDQPILWWSPDPRTILEPDAMRISRSLRKSMRGRGYRISFDQAFPQVISACAGPRRDDHGTWIVPRMKTAYRQLHRLGKAHSVEVWLEQELVGGLYGVAIGGAFFGESMFSHATDASKCAMVALCERLCGWEFELIDCQVESEHLLSLGAIGIPRPIFLKRVARATTRPDIPASDWCIAPFQASDLKAAA